MSVALDRREFQRALAQRGLLQQDLAVLAGLSESVVSQAARGRPVSAPTFRRLAEALRAAPAVQLGELASLIALAAPRPAAGQDGAAGAGPAPAAGGSRGSGAPPRA